MSRSRPVGEILRIRLNLATSVGSHRDLSEKRGKRSARFETRRSVGPASTGRTIPWQRKSGTRRTINDHVRAGRHSCLPILASSPLGQTRMSATSLSKPRQPTRKQAGRAKRLALRNSDSHRRYFEFTAGRNRPNAAFAPRGFWTSILSSVTMKLLNNPREAEIASMLEP